jgi:ABC-type Mn2+/Zn2+ transport system permease subunit
VGRRVGGLVLAAALGSTAGLVGLLASYHLAVPAGPTVAALAIAEVAVAVVARSAATAYSSLTTKETSRYA